MIQVINSGLSKLPAFLKSGSYSSIFVLVDNNTKKYCLPIVKPFLPPHTLIQIRSGEKNKSITTCQFIWESLLAKKADRNTLLINLGGGVITDMGAFCAATYMRGISFINLPTTLLAMTDAAIGGKTGIDFLGYKNMLGTFSEPKLLCVEPLFLKTLPEKHLLSASSEIFKHSLLQNKQEVAKHLRKPFLKITETERNAIIKNSIKFKQSVVASDAFETSLRKQLNLGHTLAHAFESYALMYKKPLLHGEAVALGLLGEAFIAHNFYSLSHECFLNIVFWYDLNFKKPNLKEVNFNTLLKFMKKDKKNIRSEIKMVILEKEGQVALNAIVTDNQILEALKFLLAF